MLFRSCRHKVTLNNREDNASLAGQQRLRAVRGLINIPQAVPREELTKSLQPVLKDLAGEEGPPESLLS